MSASNAFANALLLDVFKNGTYGDTYIALHTADSGAAGTQASSEAAYTGYARAKVNPTDWRVTGAAFDNISPIQFQEVTEVGAGVIATHFTIGNNSTGPGRVLLRGKLVTPLPLVVGNEPRFKEGLLQGSVGTGAPE